MLEVLKITFSSIVSIHWEPPTTSLQFKDNTSEFILPSPNVRHGPLFAGGSIACNNINIILMHVCTNSSAVLVYKPFVATDTKRSSRPTRWTIVLMQRPSILADKFIAATNAIVGSFVWAVDLQILIKPWVRTFGDGTKYEVASRIPPLHMHQL